MKLLVYEEVTFKIQDFPRCFLDNHFKHWLRYHLGIEFNKNQLNEYATNGPPADKMDHITIFYNYSEGARIWTILSMSSHFLKFQWSEGTKELIVCNQYTCIAVYQVWDCHFIKSYSIVMSFNIADFNAIKWWHSSKSKLHVRVAIDLFYWYEPSHEIMAFFVHHKIIHQMRMCSHPVGLDVWLMVGSFVYFHTSCMWTVKALARLCGWAFSS